MFVFYPSDCSSTMPILHSTSGERDFTIFSNMERSPSTSRPQRVSKE